ncbi:MAG: ABC transporter ATP-binding protein [Spirochaetaceae bacterium]|nr:ABC transporter ATP-binding protein [Spirochaetaceae bacterium]
MLSITNLIKSYQSAEERQVIFSNFSLDLAAGQTLAVTGESGSGKSTLLNLIAGLDSFEEGSIICSDYDVGNLSEKSLAAYRNKNIGFIFQFHFLLNDFTVLENVLMPSLIDGSNNLKRANYLLNKVGLNDKLNSFPQQLSGGERQRAAIARALMNNPPLILADEPTGSLDEKNSKLVEDLLFSLVKAERAAMLLVTHEQGLASKCAEQLVLNKNHATN